MGNEPFIKLTNNLYRLTLLFPKKEPLRYKMREIADNILAKPTKIDLETLDSFFEVAKNQNWVSPQDVLSIQEEYIKMGEELKELKESKFYEVESHKIGEDGGGSRQEKILLILKERGRAQVGELQELFPEVTKRTLRRDFENLLVNGLIERMGEKNETFYQVKRLRT